ncbi:MAG TPA: large conductance mechanosensitive channel protein MscL [Bryobacteraceae bacterium]|jgi:large conductance mechanosensitive channel
MIKEFKAFIAKGNVLDLAVAVIMGASFGAIVTSAVNDVIMPPIGLVLGKVDFKELFFPLDGKSYATLADAKKAAAPVIAYGTFVNTVINFLIVAFFVFLVVQAVSKMKRTEPVVEAAPTTKECPFCASTIPIKAVRCPQCTSDLKAK